MRPYQVVTARSLEELTEKVNSFYKRRWIVNGGVSYSPKDEVYMQSMVHLDEINVLAKRKDIEEKSVTKSEGEERPMPMVVGLPRTSREEIEAALWNVINYDCSDEAFWLISKKGIKTIKQLLIEMEQKWFQEEAGVSVMAELRRIVAKYKWENDN